MRQMTFNTFVTFMTIIFLREAFYYNIANVFLQNYP